MPRSKLLLTSIALGPAAALVIVSACGDSASSSGGDDPCALRPCLDGNAGTDGTVTTSDGARIEVDAGPVTDAAPPALDGDAAVVGDADQWADADPNCANYAGQSGGPVTVRVRNLRNTPIFLGPPIRGCDYNIGFELHDTADASLTLAQTFGQTCTDYQSACPTPSCASALVTKVANDGGHYDIGWPGTVFKDRFMAKSCYADKSCATSTCLQEAPAPSGTIRVNAYGGYYCDGGSCSDCTTGASTSCTIFGAVGGTSGAPLVGTATYTADGGGVINVDIGP